MSRLRALCSSAEVTCRHGPPQSGSGGRDQVCAYAGDDPVGGWRRRPKQILLIGLALVFLVGVSRSPLHWHRWIIPILPLFALFAAYGLNAAIERLSSHLNLRLSAQRGLILLVATLVAAWSGYKRATGYPPSEPQYAGLGPSMDHGEPAAGQRNRYAGAHGAR